MFFVSMYAIENCDLSKQIKSSIFEKYIAPFLPQFKVAEFYRGKGLYNGQLGIGYLLYKIGKLKNDETLQILGYEHIYLTLQLHVVIDKEFKVLSQNEDGFDYGFLNGSLGFLKILDDIVD